jgi:hypothetical protein
MDLKGTVKKVMATTTGQGKKGQWCKQEFILETVGQYPKSICMSIWGQEKIDQYDLVEGMTLTAHLELESREHNGRWYNEVRVWKIENSDRSKVVPKPVYTNDFGPSDASASADPTDELPF